MTQPTRPDPTAAECVALLRAVHVRWAILQSVVDGEVIPAHIICQSCFNGGLEPYGWPCPVIRVLDALDRAEAREAALRDLLVRIVERCDVQHGTVQDALDWIGRAVAAHLDGTQEGA